MDILELESFKLADAVKFHTKLNPKLWIDNKLDPKVRDQLLLIAKDFISELGVKDLDVKDVTISGSNAAYSYTRHSDIDLHIVVDINKLSDDEIYQELFTAKKTLYNDSHNVTIRGIPVELYVQDANKTHVSLGEYSLLRDEWNKIPKKQRANFDQHATKAKFENLSSLVELALKSKDLAKVQKMIDDIRRYRQAGLDRHGEFSPENLAFKAIRTQGGIDKLYALRDKLHSEKLSIEEDNRLLDKKTSTPDELAKKYDVPKMDVLTQLDKGIKVELEHTGKQSVAREIALDHLGERLDYYEKLAKTELEEDATAERIPSNVKKNNISLNFKKCSLSEADLRNYFYQEAVQHRKIHGTRIFSHMTDNLAWLERVDESTVSPKIKELIEFQNNIVSYDMRSKMKPKIGSKVSIVQFRPHTAENIIELRGFLTPKIIEDVIYRDAEHIAWLEFEDGTSFPDKTLYNMGYGNDFKRLTTLFFPSKHDAEKSLSFIYLIKPDGWEFGRKNLGEDATSDSDEVFFGKSRKKKVRHVPYFTGDNLSEGQRYLNNINGTLPMRLWMNEVVDILNNGIIAESIDTDLAFKVKSLEKMTVSDPIVGESYIPIPIVVSADQVYIFDIEGNCPTAVEPKFLTLVGKSPDTLTFDYNKEHLNYPYSLRHSASYSTVLVVDTVETYDKIRTLVELYFGKSLPSVHVPSKKEVSRVDDDDDLIEASGYIPSNAEKNDPRFKSALTVDVKPDSIQKNAKAFGFKTSRAGIPPKLRADGKF